MTTDDLKHAIAFATSSEHQGNLRAILAQALAACRTLATEVTRLQAHILGTRQAAPAMTLDRAAYINAACLAVSFAGLGLEMPNANPQAIGDFTLEEMLQATKVIQVADARKPLPMHTVCDPRLLAAIYTCAHYQPKGKCNALVQIGSKSLWIVEGQP